MLKQGSVAQIRSGEISRVQSQLIVCMCFYPRGIKRELIDDYRADLAPDRELFKEWKEAERTVGHDLAFQTTKYEERFSLSPIALFRLKEFSDQSRTNDIYLICQCQVGERCHRELLLLTAQLKYGAKIATIHHLYPLFQRRIADLSDTFKF